jgi:hypothetical protein
MDLILKIFSGKFRIEKKEADLSGQPLKLIKTI